MRTQTENENETETKTEAEHEPEPELKLKPVAVEGGNCLLHLFLCLWLLFYAFTLC